MLLLTVVLTAARAQANPALDCLETSARSGSLEACLNEEDRAGDIPGVAAAAPAPRPALAASAVPKPAPRRVPTPTGWTDSEDGTLEAGFYKGLDSGFKTAFAGIVWPAVAGMEASGVPYPSNVAGGPFTRLGGLPARPPTAPGRPRGGHTIRATAVLNPLSSPL